MQQQPQSKMLRVTSILTIVFAVLGLVSSAISIVSMPSVIAMYTQMGMEVPGTLSMGTIIFSVAVTLVQLAAGLLGLQAWNKPEKAKTCIIMGILILVLLVVSQVISYMGSANLAATADAIAGAGFTTTISIVSTIIGFIIPTLYLVGAIQLNKKR